MCCQICTYIFTIMLFIIYVLCTLARFFITMKFAACYALFIWKVWPSCSICQCWGRLNGLGLFNFMGGFQALCCWENSLSVKMFDWLIFANHAFMSLIFFMWLEVRYFLLVTVILAVFILWHVRSTLTCCLVSLSLRVLSNLPNGQLIWTAISFSSDSKFISCVLIVHAIWCH